jgi:hypothetical protein
LTYEADGLVSKTVGVVSPVEAVVALPADPVAAGLLPVVVPGGELATGMVSPPVESA